MKNRLYLFLLIMISFQVSSQEIAFFYDSNGNLHQKITESCEVESDGVHKIPLNVGWNLASTYIANEGQPVRSIFGNVLPNLEKVKDLSNVFDPDFQDEFNTLEYLEDGKGYWVQMSAEDVWTVKGQVLNPRTTLIPLRSGWNLIGYTCTEPQSVEKAFATIGLHLEKVKNIFESYDPNIDPVFNTLQIVEPGKAYWVKVNREIDFYYPPVEDNLTSPQLSTREEDILPAHWQTKALPNSTIAYGEVTMNGEPFKSKGWIGAFIENECRAIGEIKLQRDKSIVSLVINGETPEEVEFRLWDENMEYVSSFKTYTHPGKPFEFLLPLEFVTLADDEIENSAEGINIFPNPFGNELFLQMNLRAPGTVQIQIFTVEGKILLNQRFDEQIARDNVLKIPLSEDWKIGQGELLIIKVQTNQSSFVKKLIHSKK